MASPVFTFQFSPTTNPLDTPTWVDISSYVLDFRCSRGRQFELNRMEAGTASFTLDNSNRVFDPTNTNSPYYPNIQPMKKFQVKAVISSTTYYIFTGYVDQWGQSWDNPQWAQADCTAVDLFEFLSTAELNSAASFLTTAQGANKDLTFTSITPGAGGNSITIAYVVSGLSTPLSVNTTSLAITVHLQTNGAGAAISTASSVMSLVNTDILASGLVLVSLAPGSTGAGVPGAMGATNLAGGTFVQEVTGARINHVLDNINWPSGDRSIDTGSLSVVASTFTHANNEKARSHLSDVENSELGYVFASADGKAIFHDHNHRGTASRSVNVQGTFGDSTALGELEYVNLIPEYDKQNIYNSVSVTPSGSSIAQLAQDSTSITKYMQRDYSLNTLLINSSDALNLATAILLLYKSPLLRFQSMAIQPINDTSLWTQAVSLEIGDRVSVKRRPPDYSGNPGTVLATECWVESIAWNIPSGAADATITYLLSPTFTNNSLILDDATMGQLDNIYELSF